MSDFLTAAYPWIKSFHVIAAISWMVGLLYLPRLFVYHVERGEPGTDTSETFKIMERRLLRYIMNPAMILTWVMGLFLVLTPGIVDPANDIWFQLKFAAILGLTYCHIWLGQRRREFLHDANTRTARTYRMVNEIPTLLMIVVVIMVIAKPFS
jgi:protoporphyrinogen IX oxidase